MKNMLVSKVENMVSSSGNAVRNQFVITHQDGAKTFQSYESAVVHIDHEGSVYLDEKYWDYSTTTGKYRNQFLGENKATTQAKIDSGEYKLTNLN